MSIATTQRPRAAEILAPHRALALLLLAALALALPSAGGAQNFDTSWRAETVEPRLDVDGQSIRIGLDQAIELALSNNLGLRVQRFQRASSIFRVHQSRGIYDLQLSGNMNANDETSASASALEGADVRINETQSVNLRLDQLVPTGGTVSFDWQNSRSESNSFFSGVNPSFLVGMDVLFSQPLLRNVGRRNTNRNIEIAQVNSAISVEDLEAQVISTLQQVEGTYWSLVEARDQLGVSEESLRLAEELHEMNRIQIEVGTLAPLELVQSEAGIATREEEIIRNQAAVQDAADELRRLINLEGDRYWGYEVVPTTPPEIDRIDIDLGAAIQHAADHRPEVERQKLVVESLAIDSRFFKNQRMPALDLQVRYGYNGLGGDVIVRDPTAGFFDPNAPFIVIDGGYSDALDQIFETTFDGWSVGFNFAVPLQNRAAKAGATVAELALRQGELELEDLLLRVSTEVRTAARGVTTAAKQIDSARVSRELAEKNLDAAQKRYENGLWTSFQVLEIQEDLTAARNREVTAITGYRRALVAYYQAIGALLDENGVTVADEDRASELDP